MDRFLNGIVSRFGSKFKLGIAAGALVCGAHFPANSQAPSLGRRIASNISDAQTFVLRNSTNPAVVNRLAADLGEAPSSQRMPRLSIHFSLTASQQADLDQLLADQQDRRSSQYRKFLTPEDFAARFGLGSADLSSVTRWLESHGFSNIVPARARTSISFSGSVAQAESAFHSRIHRFSLNGETHLANTTDPELPRSLESVAVGIGGLNNFRVFAPRRKAARPQFTLSGCPDCNYVAPDDWATIYNVKPLYSAGLDGTGVAIAVIGQSDVQMSDLRAFRSAANLVPKDPTVVIPAGDVDPGIQSGDEEESDLDLEWAGAIAKNANVVFVTASPTVDNGITDSLYYAIDENLAPIITISYGYCETQTYASFFTYANGILAQAAAQGISVVAASGDDGPAACDQGSNVATHGLSVLFPASSPYATGIGGTVLYGAASSYWSSSNNASGGSALSYIPEIVWDNLNNAASGGGASMFFGKPAWQQGVGVPSDGQRDVPDLAFAASPLINPILYCGPNWCVNGFMNSSGSVNANGGTSAGAPSFAGVLALLVQKTGGPIGAVNPNLYSLAQISSNVFHDITSGNNLIYCTAGTTDCDTSGELAYSAGVGYDQATGWGSIDAYNFVEQWSGDIQLSTNPASLTLAPGTSTTATVTVTPQNNFSGNVTLTCSVSSALIDVTCSVPSTPISASGNATVTITATQYAHSAPWFRFPSGVWLAAALLAVLLTGAAFFSQRRHSTAAVLVRVSLGLCLLALPFVSCGGGSSAGTTPTPIAALVLTCSIPANAKQGVAFSSGCSASGGTAPYTYSITNGNLPPGLTINASNGSITGTPTLAQTVAFTVTASDSETPSQSVSRAILGFQVYAPLAISCPASINITAGTTVSTIGCTESGGIPPVTYSLTPASLPPGLTFNPSSVISGIATKASTSSFTITGTDSAQPQETASQAFTLAIAPPQPLSLNLPLVVTARANVQFSQGVSTYGGVPPYTFAITAGALPLGLTLNSATGNISGLPQMSGSSPVTLSVQDAESPAQTASASATFKISPPPAESGTVTITATSGSIVNTTTIAVSVPAAN